MRQKWNVTHKVWGFSVKSAVYTPFDLSNNKQLHLIQYILVFIISMQWHQVFWFVFCSVRWNSMWLQTTTATVSADHNCICVMWVKQQTQNIIWFSWEFCIEFPLLLMHSELQCAPWKTVNSKIFYDIHIIMKFRVTDNMENIFATHIPTQLAVYKSKAVGFAAMSSVSSRLTGLT